MSGKRYSDEFKIAAVRQVRLSDLNVSQVARQIGITTDSLYCWLRKYDPETGTLHNRTDDKTEIRRLQKELRRVIEERDIFERAIIYFANLRNSDAQ